MLAPIVLFVYNRPFHSKMVLENLLCNVESSQTEIFIFCDGPRHNETNLELVTQTREIVRNTKGFKKIVVIESPVNKGLANSIIDGVTEIVNKYGKVIVLEDDIVVQSGFLKFMNDALNTYEPVKKVMHISGYVFPFHDGNYKKDIFFVKPTTCWGWATWKDAWSKFEKNPSKQIELIEKKGWKEFTINYSFMDYKQNLFDNLNGKMNTWAIFWYASVFLNKGYSIHPTYSLVENIGFDGTGVHCGNSDENQKLNDKKNTIESLEVKFKKIKYPNNEYTLLKFFFNKYSNRQFNTHLSFRDKSYLFRKKLKKIITKIFR
jgi:hypothetical protein